MTIKMIQVFAYLRPGGGYVIEEGNFAGALYSDGIKPITLEEYKAAIEPAALDIKEKAALKIAAKAALLAKLGLTADELKTLLN